MPVSMETASYKDRPAVRVTTEVMTALFLPEDGGKLVSVRSMADGFEFLCQNPAPAYAPLTLSGSYIASECSSWDDMFPTIDPWTPEDGPYAGRTWLDHGEVCRLKPEAVITDGGVPSLTMTARSRMFPGVITFRKRITPRTDGALDITYTLDNAGRHPFPYIWAAHCMLAGADDLRVRTPYAPDAPVAWMFGNDGREDLPRDRLTGYIPGAGAAYKLYYTEPTSGGFISGEYLSSGHAFEMDYRGNAEAIPYIGVWINNGGFKSLYNIALECCSAPYDSPEKAAAHGYCSVLPPHTSKSFTVTLRVL